MIEVKIIEALETILIPEIFSELAKAAWENNNKDAERTLEEYKKRTVENMRIMARQNLLVEHKDFLRQEKHILDKTQKYLLEPGYLCFEELHEYKSLELDGERTELIADINIRRKTHYKKRELNIPEYTIYIEE